MTLWANYLQFNAMRLLSVFCYSEFHNKLLSFLVFKYLFTFYNTYYKMSILCTGSIISQYFKVSITKRSFYKRSLHLPAFGKDRKTSFLSFSSLGAVSKACISLRSLGKFLNQVALGFAMLRIKLSPSPLFEHKQLCSHYASTPPSLW